MRLSAVLSILLSLSPTLLAPLAARAQDVERYTVYCADDKIEISFWDLAQMKVRRGSDVCQFQSYTSSSNASDFARKNFGGEGQPCSC
jgi:hypothetical protein